MGLRVSPWGTLGRSVGTVIVNSSNEKSTWMQVIHSHVCKWARHVLESRR